MDKSANQKTHLAEHRQPPWWKNRYVAFSIAYPVMIMWGAGIVVSLSFFIFREMSVYRTLSISDVMRIIEQSFLGCGIASAAFATVFGIPLGIIQVLAKRSQLLDLEQELEFREK